MHRGWRWAAVAWALLGCDERIQHGLDEREANELQATLVQRGFDVQKVVEPGKKPTWALEVGSEQAVNATRVLAELGLPRHREKGSLEVMGGTALVPSPAEERARQVLGLAGDLAHTLENVEGVASARVHLVIPLPPRYGAPAAPAKAAAYLRVLPGAAARVESLRADLRALVAGSVEGLSPEHVTLVVNEVSTAVPTPAAVPSRLSRVRALALALGVCVSVLALVVGVLSVRLRQLKASGTRESSLKAAAVVSR